MKTLALTIFLLHFGFSLGLMAETLSNAPATAPSRPAATADAPSVFETEEFKKCIFPTAPSTTAPNTAANSSPNTPPNKPNTAAGSSDSHPNTSGPETKPPAGPKFHKIDPNTLPISIGEGSLDEIKKALQRQLDSCKNKDQKAVFKFNITGEAASSKEPTRKQYCTDTNTELLNIAKTVKTVPELMAKAKDKFDWYQSDCDDGSGKVLFTGYHAPVLRASRTRQGEFQVPVFKAPPELKAIRVVDLQDKKTCESFLARPEITIKTKDTIKCLQDENGTRTPPDRKAIMDGALRGREKELAIGYLKSELDVYLFQVEGAGIFNFSDDGTDSVFVNFETSASFTKKLMLAKVMRCEGLPSSAWGTATQQRQYFDEHKKELKPTLEVLRNYVFFNDTKKGVLGSDDIELSGASVATDDKTIAAGVPMIMMTSNSQGGPKYSALKVAQDVGSAINGGCHVDVFYGQDAYAEKMSNEMTAHGSLFIALPKDTSSNATTPPAAAPAAPAPAPTAPPVAVPAVVAPAPAAAPLAPQPSHVR